MSLRELEIDSIRVRVDTYQRVVILRVKDADRYLPIWIGPSEADAIALTLQDVSVPRPLTHDLLGSVIDSLGASVTRIVVSDLSQDTFFAKIVIQHNGTTTEVDSRPSDAIALAVRTKAPIFAENIVIEKASVEIDGSRDISHDDIEDEDQQQPIGEGELKKLSAFSDFIDTLDLENLGKGNKPPSGKP